MVLFQNGKLVSTDKEVELFPTNKELGFNVLITFANGSTREAFNVTEVHYRYDGTDVAVESDIHSTGFCTPIEARGIASVVVNDTDKLWADFF